MTRDSERAALFVIIAVYIGGAYRAGGESLASDVPAAHEQCDETYIGLVPGTGETAEYAFPINICL
jgi:hypothetical protein